MKFEKLRVLSEKDIAAIHDATVDVLENCGVLVHSKMVLDLLASKGADVDYGKKLAKIPGKIVEECLKTVPKTFTLFDRNGQPAFEIGDETPRCASGHNAIFVADSQTNKRRYANVKDVEEFALISDKLEDIDIVGVPLNPQDTKPKSTLLHAVKALYENTTKPLFFSTESKEVNAAILEMMQVIAGVKGAAHCPTAISQLSPTSPLYWEPGAVEGIVDTANAGIPLNILPEPMSGVSAPYSVAGLLTVHNIECVSGVVISQLVKPGTPVLYGSSWTTYDMKSTNAVIGSPETSLLRVAGCQMARYYNMPSHTTAPNSDANAHDEQLSWEKTISNLCAILAQNDIVMNSGMFATGLSVSLEQLVVDDEMNGIIRRLARGIDVSRESIAAEVIKNVGPAGDFLMEDHTLDNLYGDEFRNVKVSNFINFEAWEEKGCPTVVDNAREKVKAYLAEGNAKPLDAEKEAQIAKIIAVFEEKYC